MKWIRVRLEQTAAFAAGAETHLAGKLAVCAGNFPCPDDYVGAGQGFWIVHVRAVLSRRGDEIIDLARVNLLR